MIELRIEDGRKRCKARCRARSSVSCGWRRGGDWKNPAVEEEGAEVLVLEVEPEVKRSEVLEVGDRSWIRSVRWEGTLEWVIVVVLLSSLLVALRC